MNIFTFSTFLHRPSYFLFSISALITIYIAFDRILCETVRDFITKVSDVGVLHGDKDLNEKCHFLKSKLSHLLDVLKDEQSFFSASFNVIIPYFILLI